MPAPSLSPFSAFAAFSRFTPTQPLQAFLRATAYKLRPAPRPVPHVPSITRAQNAVLASTRPEERHLVTLLCEKRNGSRPTIVLGGFVPDATEQVFLLRGFLLRHGSVYYLNYPRGGFSSDLFYAQLDDLVAELNELHGQRPVILGVSFGAGLVLEWLRRLRLAHREDGHAGIVLVSPVACIADLLIPNQPKPSTLLGRAIKPFIDAGPRVEKTGIDRARLIFTKMFEAGAQNKALLSSLMSAGELRALRAAVLGSIHDISSAGACERVAALNRMPTLSAWSDSPRPLSELPALILYAEKEDAVLTENSPTRAALETTLSEFFPRGICQVVSGGTSPVQHASLIFHYSQFLPPIAAFYRDIKVGKVRLAA